jgi:glutathione S-transferase
MKLYDFPFSPNCRKVRAVAYELGIPLDREIIDVFAGGSRTPAFLAKNPMGRLPVLEDGELRLWESTAIIRHLARGSALVPTEPHPTAEMERWIAWQLAHLGPAMRRIAYERLVKPAMNRGAPDAKLIAEATAEFDTLTGILDAALADRSYVAGPLTLADFALAAHYSLASACDLDLSRWPHATAWLARVCARDSMKRALSDSQADR